MKCHLYAQVRGGPPLSLGFCEVAGEVQARHMAVIHLERLPEADAIDIWWQSGELMRVERPRADAAMPPPGKSGDGPRLRS